jgi:hypothetical protein
MAVAALVISIVALAAAIATAAYVGIRARADKGIRPLS